MTPTRGPRPEDALVIVHPETGPAHIDLARVREILPQLIDSLSDAVVVVDRDQRVVAANRRYLESFGANHEPIVGVACRDSLNCPELAAGGHESCVACSVLAHRKPERRTRTIADAAGVQRRWEATFNPVIGDAGDVTHVVEVWRDISERTRLEAQLSHSERLAAIGVLAAGVGHEINNPIASVLMGVESLRRWIGRGAFDPASLEEAADLLGVIETETRRCRETSDKLMLLAQPVSGAPSPVELNAVVSDTLSLLQFEMRKQAVVARAELADDLPEVWGREGGLRGVCMNLMLNAVQAMTGAGGTLTVRTRARGATVVLEVEDDGPGIPEALSGQVWDAFFTTKPVGQGTGLGLSITQSIVARHGGAIRIETPEGGGARFVVELPLRGPGGDGV